MSFTTLDSINTARVAGKVRSQTWTKVVGAAAYTAARWNSLFTLVGDTGAGTYPGVALTAATLSDVSGGKETPGSIYHGGNKSADIKYLMNMEAISAAATIAPSYLLLVDLLAYYPGINMNSALAQTMLSSAAGSNILPTRQGGQHSGANAFMFLEAAATIGASPFNIAVTYTNSALANPKSLGATVSGVVSSIVPQIVHSGVAVNNFGPFMPLAAGDRGVASVQTVQLSGASGTASTATLVICEPIAALPIHLAASATVRDFLFTYPRLPQIKDGACLSFLLYTGAALAATSTLYGAVDVAWG